MLSGFFWFYSTFYFLNDPLQHFICCLFLQAFRGESVNTQVLKKDADGLCSLSHVALCLFEEVCLCK